MATNGAQQTRHVCLTLTDLRESREKNKMPPTTSTNNVSNNRILVDDLPYIDQEYGNANLREIVSPLNSIFLPLN